MYKYLSACGKHTDYSKGGHLLGWTQLAWQGPVPWKQTALGQNSSQPCEANL